MQNNSESHSKLAIVQSFDKLKKTSSRGTEYWLARQLQILLGYTDWRNFKDAIDRAKMACESTGNNPSRHFGNTTNMVTLGMGTTRKVNDIAMTRFACYLVAMNGDPSKPEIAAAQTYFAVKTRQQEISEQENNTESRLSLRNRVKDANKYLNSAAKESGVENYGLFHDAGYRGLYGELGLKDIKNKKGINQKEDLLDYIDRAELAANEFRITQTELRLRNQQIKGEHAARETHHHVGQEVRNTIKKIGGKMPEELPAVSSIKQLKKEKKQTNEIPPSST